MKPDLSPLKNRYQTFSPSMVNKNSSFFFKQVSKEIEDLPISKISSSQMNLSNKQKLSLEHFKSYTHLTIKSSDKGGNVVVHDNTKYKSLRLYILDNESWYKCVPLSMFDVYAQEVYVLVDEAFSNQIISKTILEYIRTPSHVSQLSTAYQKPTRNQTHYLDILLSQGMAI